MRSLSPRLRRRITIPSVRWSAMGPGSGREEKAELAQRRVVLPPVLPDRHAQIEERLEAEEPLQVPTRRSPDRAQHGPAGADHDPLLGLLLDENGGADVEPATALALHELFDPDRARVGHFLVRELEDLLPDALGNVEGLRLGGQGVGG